MQDVVSTCQPLWVVSSELRMWQPWEPEMGDEADEAEAEMHENEPAESFGRRG